MDYRFSTIRRLIVALILAILAEADYIMDDSNVTIQYFGDWSRNVTSFNFDAANLYNDTATIGFGSIDLTYVKIPFVGTGIIVYIATLTVDQLNLSCFIDENPRSAFFSGFNSSSLYNLSVYNTQGLSYAAHTLAIFNEGDGPDSGFALDYLVISTPISTLSSSSAIPSSTGNTSPSNQRSHKQLPAIGGAIGGVAAVTLAVVLAVLYYQKKGPWLRRLRVEVDLEPKEASFHSTRFISDPPVDPSHDWSPSSLLPGDINLQNNDISLPHIPPKPDTPLVTEHIPALSMASTTTSQYTLSGPSRQPAEAEAIARAFAAPSAATPISTSSPMNAGLTEEQSGLVQGLLRQNIPLVTVVGVMEGLLGREGPSGGGEGSGSRIASRDVRPEADDPPDYVSV